LLLMRLALRLSFFSGLFTCLTTWLPVVAQSRLADYTYGGNDLETCAGSLPTADGGLLFGGSTHSGISGEVSQASPAPTAAPSIDYWLVKTDAQGRKLWDKRYGGAGDDRLVKLVATADGGFLLCGWSTSEAGFDKTEPSWGQQDYWVVKVDAQGTKQWDKRFGTRDADFLVTAVAAADGGFLLVGWSGTGPETAAKTAPNGDRTEPLLGVSDVWVVKIDAQGSKQWDKRLGGPGAEYVYAAISVPGGGFVLGALPFVDGGGGGSAPGGDVTEAGRGGHDYWLVKLDAQGQKVWDHLYGGSGSDAVQSLVATADGGLLAAGTSSSPVSGDKTSANVTKACWLVKLDGQGVRQWDQVYGNSSGLAVLQPLVQLNPAGGYWLGGTSGEHPPFVGTTQVPYDFWLAELDGNGRQQGEHTYGGAKDEYLTSIMALPTGGALLVGTSLSDRSGDKTADSRGSTDLWAIQVATTVLSTSGAQPPVTSHISLFPNPVQQGPASLEVAGLPASGAVQVEICTLLGQSLQTLTLPAPQGHLRHPLDLSALAPGVYLLRVRTAEGVRLTRFVKT
jgi:hypothetical protein